MLSIPLDWITFIEDTPQIQWCLLRAMLLLLPRVLAAQDSICPVDVLLAGVCLQGKLACEIHALAFAQTEGSICLFACPLADGQRLNKLATTARLLP